MVTLTSIQSPSFEPISLDDAKAWLRIDYDNDDSLITRLITEARARIETETGLILASRAFQIDLNGWPGELLNKGRLALPIRPVKQPAYVLGREDAHSASETITDAFSLETEDQQTFLVFDRSHDPELVERIRLITVIFAAGLGTSMDGLPESLRHATRLILLESWRARLEDSGDDLRPAIDRALQPWRRMSL